MAEEINDIHTLRFIELLSSLDEATMAFLGKKAHPGTGKVEKNLPMARWNIDVITALEKKSEGNRGELEEKVLQQILSRLRLNYVDVAGETAGTSEEGEKKEAAAAPSEGGGNTVNNTGGVGADIGEKKDTPAGDDAAGKAEG